MQERGRVIKIFSVCSLEWRVRCPGFPSISTQVSQISAHAFVRAHLRSGTGEKNKFDEPQTRAMVETMREKGTGKFNLSSLWRIAAPTQVLPRVGARDERTGPAAAGATTATTKNKQASSRRREKRLISSSRSRSHSLARALPPVCSFDTPSESEREMTTCDKLAKSSVLRSLTNEATARAREPSH